MTASRRSGFDRRSRLETQLGPQPPEGARERPSAPGLHDVQARHRIDHAQRGGVREPQRDPRGERAAAHLDHDPVDRATRCPDAVDHLPRERRTALDRQPVVRALAGERDGAGGDRLLEPEVRGVTGLARLPRAHDHARPERPQLVHDAGIRAVGDEHPQLAPAGPGDDRCREGRVATARDGQRQRRIEPGDRVGDPELQQHPEQVAGLVRSGNVAGLVLDPHRAPGSEPRGIGEPAGEGQRRRPEAVPRDLRHGIVQLPHEVHVARVRPARGPGHVIGVEQRAVPDERVRIQVAGGLQAGEVERPDQDMVDVVARPACRAARRERPVRGRHGPAPGADQRRLHRGWLGRRRGRRPGSGAHSRLTPTRSLNSPISSSQRSTIPRVAAQNAGSRRSSNSSIGTPCCSTHV